MKSMGLRVTPGWLGRQLEHEARVRKALKLLEAIAEPHDQPEGDDHAWRRCRRCLALEEAGREHGRKLIGEIATLLGALLTPGR
jgi:hypothetical protein